MTKTEVSVDKEITGNENDESRQVPAVRHLNYRRGVYQHEFNLHEYINEREEMIRYLISEKEHCKKIDKQLNKLVKDAEDLTRKTEMKTSDGNKAIFKYNTKYFNMVKTNNLLMYRL